MCNIAGYIGDELAAPILLEMTERQQGFAGGYSTGIATIYDGELHSAKVVGDVSTLKAETIAANLPGKIGIVHSRSRGGGGLCWAHPFLDCEKRIAYLANGDIGLFQEEWNANRIAEELIANGHTFDSKIGESPLWNPNSNELFYQSGNSIISVQIVLENGIRIGTEETIFSLPMIQNLNLPNFDYDPVADRFLIIISVFNETQKPLSFIINRFEELKRLSPVDKE